MLNSNSQWYVLVRNNLQTLARAWLRRGAVAYSNACRVANSMAAVAPGKRATDRTPC